MIDFSAADILAMNVKNLQELRAEVTQAQPEGLPTDAFLEFEHLIDALEQNGSAGGEFEELGGKAALERTIGRLNALDFGDMAS